jgi:membrane fusion protein, multidrug efflux system
MNFSAQKIIMGMMLITMMLSGCTKKDDMAAEVDFTKVTNVEVYTVSLRDFDDFITLPVIVSPYRAVNLGLPNGGKVTKINVDKGDRTTKGNVLLETDDVLLRVQYEQAVAHLEYQKKDHARSEKLFRDGSITNAAFDASKFQLSTTQSSCDMAKKQYEDAVLKAPFSGTVTARHVEIGDILAPGSPAFRIIDVSRVKVQAGIPEKYIASFNIGNDVSISFDALPGRTFKARINYIAPEASPSVRTFLAEMVVDNNDGAIRIGIMGNARILKKKTENSILVPINALIETQKGRVVFVAKEDNTVEERLIEYGESNDTMVHIISGLQPGDKIIARGQHDLVTGERINITGEYAGSSVGGYSI